MIRGMYTSAWSMKAVQRKMDVISNNISNVNTNAYKKDFVTLKTFQEVLTDRIDNNNISQIGTMHLGSDVDSVHTYFKQGSIKKTDGRYDFAIKGSPSAFFTVSEIGEDGQQKEFYTRNGSFRLSSSNELITSEGYRVMGEEGPVVLDNGEFILNKDGVIMQGDNRLDKLLVRDFANTNTLRKYGYNMFQKTEETIERDFKGNILQGSLEGSNVNTINEMVEMINIMRSYQINQRIIMAQDSTLDKAVNQIGKVI